MDSEANMKSLAILAVDIGTTNLKCSLYDSQLEVINSSTVKLETLQPCEGFSELDPEHLMQSVKECAQLVLKNPVTHQIASFGLSTQRNSFILWNKATGECYTKFILWNDKRPASTSRTLNSGLMLNATKRASGLISYVMPGGSGERYRAVSKYKVEIYHVAPKLIDELRRLEARLTRVDFDNVVYGTIDTWLFWNASREKIFITDITSASCSGFYDIYLGKWSELLAYFFQLPRKILPQVTNNCGNFGLLDKEFLGLSADVPIKSVIGDCQASLIAECAFQVGDVVITIGTGSFISANIGSRPISSEFGSYPMAGYKDATTQIYIIHSPVSSAGICINWAKSIGLFETYEELETILATTPTSNGVYFVPAFGFIEIDNGEKTSVGTGFIGLKPTTTKAEMMRAIMDSIAYSIKLRMELVLRDLKHHNIPLNSVRISGGVSKNEVFCQFLCNLIRLPIEKSNFSYTSSAYGAAFLAGLGAGMFTKLTDLANYRKVERVYRPDAEFISRSTSQIEDYQEKWKSALERFIDWTRFKS